MDLAAVSSTADHSEMSSRKRVLKPYVKTREESHFLFNSPTKHPNHCFSFDFIKELSRRVSFPHSPLFPFLLSYIVLRLGLNSESTRFWFVFEYRAPSSLSFCIISKVVGTFADFWRWEVLYDVRYQCTCSHLKAPELELPLLWSSLASHRPDPGTFGRLCLLAGRSAVFLCLQ